MKEKLKTIKNVEDICDYICFTFSDIFDEGKYDEVANILDSFEVADFHDDQVPVTLLCFSNAVDPLMRKTPAKEKIEKLHLARIKFYAKCELYYKDHKDREGFLSGMMPEDYEKTLNFYKSIGMKI